jgi:hypothetical protein
LVRCQSYAFDGIATKANSQYRSTP